MTNILPTKNVLASTVEPGDRVVHHDQQWVVNEISRSLEGLRLMLVPADGRTKRRTRLDVDADTQLHLEGDRQVQLQALKELASGHAKVKVSSTEWVTFEFEGGWEFTLAAAPIVTVDESEDEPADEGELVDED